VSSVYVSIPGYGGILVDAGEGTLGQLSRKYGDHSMPALLSELQCILVTHLHADHHLGMIRILLHRSALCPGKKLTIIAPQVIEYWLQEYAEIEPLEYIFIPCHSIMQEDQDCPSFLQVKKDLGLKVLRAVPVIHCADA